MVETTPEEECSHAVKQVSLTTGEEAEHLLLHLKAKLYRFDKEGNQWKERGIGTVKLLKHEDTQKVRLVMRQSKTHKICANHLVLPSLSMQEHAGNSKSCVWHATDFSDGNLKEELFCIRFVSSENCKVFKEMIEAAKSQQEVEESEEVTSYASEETTEEEAQSPEKAQESTEGATLTTNLFEKFSVEESNYEEEECEALDLALEDEWVIV